MIAEAIILAALVVLVVASLTGTWRRSLACTLIWSLGEATFRVAVIDGFWVPLVKDAFLLLVYLRMLNDPAVTRRREWTPWLAAALSLFAIAGFASAFRPAIPTPLVPLLALKTYFFYIPLMYAGAVIAEEQHLLPKRLQTLTVVAFGLTLIAILQLVGGDGGIGGFFATRERSIQDAGELELATSLFTGEGRFAAAMMFVIFLSLVGLALKPRGVMIVGLAIAFVGLVISARRTPLFITLGIGGFVMLALIARRMMARRPRRRSHWLLWVIVGSAVVGGTVVATWSSTSTAISFYQFTFTGDPEDQIFGRIRVEMVDAPLQVLIDSSFAGYGTGLYVQGTEAYLGVADRPPVYSDGLLCKVSGEMGLLGLIAVVTLHTTIIGLAVYGAKRRPRDQAAAAWVLIALQVAYLLTALKGGQVYTDAFQLVWYWMATGMLLQIALPGAQPNVDKASPASARTYGSGDQENGALDGSRRGRAPRGRVRRGTG